MCTLFLHVERVGSSYIDHCLVSERLEESETRFQVHYDYMSNTSAHLSIDISINVDSTFHKTNRSFPPPDRLAWNKVSKEQIEEKYTITLQELLSHIPTQYNIVNDSVGLHLEVDDI